MPIHWGVDSSYNHADRIINIRTGRPAKPPRHGEPQGDDEETLYDYVTRRMGQEPEFWGRYLNYESPSGATLPSVERRRATQLRPAERDYIFRRSRGNCRILLNYNAIGQNAPGRRGEAGYQSGFNEVQKACRIARSLGAPSGVRIYADLEYWPATPDWIRGWWDAMFQSEYAGLGGFYGRGAEFTLEESFDPDARPRHPQRFWSTRVPIAARQQQEWVMETLMQRATGRAGPGSHHNLSCYVWTTIPRGPRGQAIREFRGVGPAGGATTVIWQYAMDSLQYAGEGTGLVDLDVATDLGFQDMWRGTE